MNEQLSRIDRPIDCIFCFGVFYHIDNHIPFLKSLSDLPAKYLIVDTNVSQIRYPAIQLRIELGKTGEKRLVGHPSKTGLETMMQYFGWQTKQFDWKASGLIDGMGYRQYEQGNRVTVVGSR
jgi:hypothetical protein